MNNISEFIYVEGGTQLGAIHQIDNSFNPSPSANLVGYERGV